MAGSVYSALVRELFHGSRAEPPPDLSAGDWVVGEAGGIEMGTWIRFAFRVPDGRVTEARFKAYGCPHTLAAVTWLADRARGKTLEELSAESLEELATRLEVPVEKLGRLLIVQDALRGARQRKIGTAPGRKQEISS
jgi:NifU-like protein involved in Fe-S cluster formation